MRIGTQVWRERHWRANGKEPYTEGPNRPTYRTNPPRCASNPPKPRLRLARRVSSLRSRDAPDETKPPRCPPIEPARTSPAERDLQPVAQPVAQDLLAQRLTEHPLRDLSHPSHFGRARIAQPLDRGDRALRIAVSNRHAEVVAIQQVRDVRRPRAEVEDRAADGH